MKVLQIGCGGIGSYFTENLFNSIEGGHIDEPIELTIADDDMVESKQVLWQNFTLSEVGLSKAESMGVRFKCSIKGRINTKTDLKGFDLIVLCVDNDVTRHLVVEYCHKMNKQFIDLRATGRKVFAMPKLKTAQENLKFIDESDLKEYSCQDKEDLNSGWIQIGNKVVAMIGVQMLMNHLRGHNNHVHNYLI